MGCVPIPSLGPGLLLAAAAPTVELRTVGEVGGAREGLEVVGGQGQGPGWTVALCALTGEEVHGHKYEH